MDSESMLKGRMAESLVEELFKNSGNKIYRFGYEAIVQNLTQIERSFNRDGEVGKRICAIPDFIVIDKQGNPTFVEVKFRGNGQLHTKDHERLMRIKEFWSANIIIVNCNERPFFRISKPPYFDKQNKFIEAPLIEESLWNMNLDAYQKAEVLVEKFLTNNLIKK